MKELGNHGRERWMNDVSSDGSVSGPAPRRRHRPRVFVKSTVCAFSIGFALVSASAYASDDLLSLYRVARAHSPMLRQALANYHAVQESWPQALAGLLPHISVQASRGRVHQDRQITGFSGFGSASAGGTYFNSTQYSLKLTQTIFDYSAYQRLDQATAKIAQAAAQVHAAEQKLILKLAQRYFDVLSARADLKFARSNLKAIKRQLERARERFQVGLIAHTAVEEARARRDLARARLIQAKNAVANQLAALRELIGRQPERLAGLARKPELKKPQPAKQDLWQLAALDHNWRLIAARKGAEAAMEHIQVARGGHFPTISLTASASHQESGGIFGGETDRQSITIQGTLPLFQGFAVVSQVDEAQARYTQALARLEEVRRNVRRKTANAYRAVLTSIRRVQALQQAVVSNRSALEATRAGYRAGTRTIVDVLNAQSNLFGAIRDYKQAQYAYLVNTLKLKRAAGTLDPKDLRAVNSLLSAE